MVGLAKGNQFNVEIEKGLFLAAHCCTYTGNNQPFIEEPQDSRSGRTAWQNSDRHKSQGLRSLRTERMKTGAEEQYAKTPDKWECRRIFKVEGVSNAIGARIRRHGTNLKSLFAYACRRRGDAHVASAECSIGGHLKRCIQTFLPGHYHIQRI